MKVQLFFPASFACLTALILVLRFTEVQPQPDFKVSQYVKYEKDEKHFIEVRLEVKGLSIGNYAPSLRIGDDKFDGFRTEQIQGSTSTLIGFDVPLDESTNRLEKLCVTLESVQKDCRFRFPSIHDIQPGNPLEDDKLAVGGGEGGGGGDCGRGELLEAGLLQSGLESGFVSVLQGSGSNL